MLVEVKETESESDDDYDAEDVDEIFDLEDEPIRRRSDDDEEEEAEDPFADSSGLCVPICYF